MPTITSNHMNAIIAAVKQATKVPTAGPLESYSALNVEKLKEAMYNIGYVFGAQIAAIPAAQNCMKIIGVEAFITAAKARVSEAQSLTSSVLLEVTPVSIFLEETLIRRLTEQFKHGYRLGRTTLKSDPQAADTSGSSVSVAESDVDLVAENAELKRKLEDWQAQEKVAQEAAEIQFQETIKSIEEELAAEKEQTVPLKAEIAELTTETSRQASSIKDLVALNASQLQALHEKNAEIDQLKTQSQLLQIESKKAFPGLRILGVVVAVLGNVITLMLAGFSYLVQTANRQKAAESEFIDAQARATEEDLSSQPVLLSRNEVKQVPGTGNFLKFCATLGDTSHLPVYDFPSRKAPE